MTGDFAAAGQDEHRDSPKREHAGDPTMQVRADDLEPYVGLRYLSKLFKLMAIVLLLLLVAEVITGLIGASFIGFALLSSIRYNKKHRK